VLFGKVLTADGLSFFMLAFGVEVVMVFVVEEVFVSVLVATDPLSFCSILVFEGALASGVFLNMVINKTTVTKKKIIDRVLFASIAFFIKSLKIYYILQNKAQG
jgi:hypothetical protein